ncbi:MAG TPA: glycoside hydrolase family 16 protein, partial [Bacteroidia bacterium]|nr:glycoside hydrolase family 16 protein [Bacteroidia bacterium]
MKNFFLLLLTVLTFKLSFAQKQKVVASTDGNCNEVKWELKFEDNFDGTTLDLNKWHMKYAPGTLSTEAVEVYYSIENIKFENGICKIIPKKETVKRKAVSWQSDSTIVGDNQVNIRQYPYTSGWMDSNEQFLYGKFEVRCKIPKAKGLWPSFWMYGEPYKINNEIDVFEFWNEENVFGKYNSKKLSMVNHMTVHYNKKMSGKSYI